MKLFSTLIWILGAACCLFAANPVGDTVKTVSFDSFTNGYFELRFPKKQSDETLSLAVFTEKRTFEEAVGFFRLSTNSIPRRAALREVPTNAFKTNIIAAVVHRTNKWCHYHVEQVTVESKTAVIHFQMAAVPIPPDPTPPRGKRSAPASKPAMQKENPPPALQGASSLLLVLLPRGDFSQVKFVENNQPIGEAKIPEQGMNK